MWLVFRREICGGRVATYFFRIATHSIKAAALNNMADVAAALDANDNAAFGGAMKEMGGACKGCHKKFRAE